MTNVLRRYTAAVVSVALGIAATACDSHGHASAHPKPRSTNPPVTSAVGNTAAPYARPGPHAPGLAVLRASGREIVVLYPADPASAAGHPRASYDGARLHGSSEAAPPRTAASSTVP